MRLRGSIIEFPRKLTRRMAHNLKNHVSPVRFRPSAQAENGANLLPGLPGFDDVTIRFQHKKRAGGRPTR